MSNKYGPKIVTDGLTICLDAADLKSYSGSGTIWTDRAGNNNGTLINGSSYSIENKGIITFDGINDYIQLSSILLSKTGAAICCWLNIDDFTTGKSNTSRVLFRDSSVTFHKMITFYNGGYTFEVDTNGNPFEISSSASVPDILNSNIIANTWFHFCLVFDSDNFYGYVNGEQSGTGAISNNLTINRIGDATSFADAYPAFFKGKVSSVYVYNRSLNSEEILQNYNATKGRFGL
jgi:hypothetical protein